MNKLQHLYAALGEECGEVQQVVGKSLRFGEYDHHPKTGNVPNFQLLSEEIADLVAVYQMICVELCEEPIIDEEHIRKKKLKVEHYYEVSRNNDNR